MTILETLVQLRDDIKAWVTNNLNALNSKIDSKTIPIDSKLSSTSTNPVQNKVIDAELTSLNERVGTTPVATQISTAIANQPTFSGDYNDLKNAPNITEDGSGDMVIADNDGNVIFKADALGIHSTNLSLTEGDIRIENNDNLTIADDEGNVIFKVDAEGTHTTDVEVGDVSLEQRIPIWDAKSNFSGDYADLIGAPDIIEDNEGNVIFTDEDGNIIFQIDANGAETTDVKLGEVQLTQRIPVWDNKADKAYVDQKVAELVNSAPETLNTLDELAAALGDDENFAATITQQIGNKVDKVPGKGLSTEDFTTAEKEKLAALGNTEITIDAALSPTSENPVQNKVVYNALNSIDFPVDSVNGKTGEVVLKYEDIENAPEIEEDGSNTYSIVDKDGNIIFEINADEKGTTNVYSLAIQGLTLEPISDEDIIALVNEAFSQGGN